MKILFAEDDKDILELYVEEVHHVFPDYEVLSAEDGEQALKICNENKIDLVFTDGKMPKLDGFELALELKKREYAAPVIMITGHHENLEDDKLNSFGIKKVFYKPVTFDEIINCIKNL